MYHEPVMPNEVIQMLNINPAGTYVDATFGGGGHSRMILQSLNQQGRLLGFDQDEDVVRNCPDDLRFVFVKANFRFLRQYLRLNNVNEIDGVLADLGVSSFQIDSPTRGFSTRFDGPLDMRMDAQQENSATQIVNSYTVDDLQKIFSEYGELRNSKSLAAAVSIEREVKKFESTSDFKFRLKNAVRGNENKYWAQVFQALRMEVNDELNSLKEFLTQCGGILKPGGRIVIISYHSLEDRLVKNYFRSGNIEGEIEKDFFGVASKPFELITKKPVTPTEEEIIANPRSRSGRLRAAQKN